MNTAYPNNRTSKTTAAATEKIYRDALRKRLAIDLNGGWTAENSKAIADEYYRKALTV